MTSVLIWQLFDIGDALECAVLHLKLPVLEREQATFTSERPNNGVEVMGIVPLRSVAASSDPADVDRGVRTDRLLVERDRTALRERRVVGRQDVAVRDLAARSYNDSPDCSP